jgi:hypothetical protein
MTSIVLLLEFQSPGTDQLVPEVRKVTFCPPAIALNKRNVRAGERTGGTGV